MASALNENGIFLALQAIQNDRKLSVKKAAEIYNIPRTTLIARRDGRSSRRDTSANSKKLSDSEEKAIVQRALELDAQGFPVRLSGIEDMANKLLLDRDALPVGKNWSKNFIQRQPELKTRLSRPYDYQRALCEDPEKIRAWFDLVRNFTAKYGIRNEDIYNFDETGFLMGVLGPTTVVTSSDRTARAKLVQAGNREWVTVIQGVNSAGWTIPPFVVFKGKWHLSSWYEDGRLPHDWRVAVSENGWTTNEVTLDWLKHFNKFTWAKKVGGYRLLVLDGHESHHSYNFEEYCKENNILTLCMPAHSSHLLQPLDVGCFGPLKKAYSRQIEDLVRARITYISKESFLPAFQEAFKAAMTQENVRGGFQGAGLVPYDPERVISQLNVQISTPTPESSRPSTSHSWISKTPQTVKDASSHTTLIKNRIVRHQSSSPSHILDAVDLFAKGMSKVMHQHVLLKAENESLRKANDELSRRRHTKKRRVQQGGSLGLQDIQDLEAQGDVERQIQEEESKSQGKRRRVETSERRCGRCGETGHNVRTCQADSDASSKSDDI